ncbi:hypothetical protein [Streptomyces sp. KL116D]|uniref:hypothetical protein n=1 Tax=Streptomyces sp. KL116D TaxID=3045152 RepID=UPI0035581ECC
MDYLTADEEDRFVIAQANAPLTDELRFAEAFASWSAVVARGRLRARRTDQADYMDVSCRARWCRSRPP